jgi:hypothetical protein
MRMTRIQMQGLLCGALASSEAGRTKFVDGRETFPYKIREELPVIRPEVALPILTVRERTPASVYEQLSAEC